MVIDYERAWTELGAFVSTKTQHGREGLLTEMAQIADRCRVPSGELSRLLRLYGVEVERARSIEAEPHRDEPGDFDDGLGSPSDPELPGHHRLGGHDGGRNGSAALANGRRGG